MVNFVKSEPLGFRYVIDLFLRLIYDENNMEENRLSPRQLRMARASLGWTVDRVCDETGLSDQTVQKAEKDGHALRESTAQLLRQRYEDAGLRFLPNEGVQRRDDDIISFVGSDSYMRLLDDVLVTLKPMQGEVLFSGCDERRSPPSVVEKLRELRAAGIKMRSLIKVGNNFYMGPREEYRTVDEHFFSPHDVVVIYHDRAAFSFSSEVPQRLLSIRSMVVADHLRRQFEFMWANSRMPAQETDSHERY